MQHSSSRSHFPSRRVCQIFSFLKRFQTILAPALECLLRSKQTPLKIFHWSPWIPIPRLIDRAGENIHWKQAYNLSPPIYLLPEKAKPQLSNYGVVDKWQVHILTDSLPAKLVYLCIANSWSTSRPATYEHNRHCCGRHGVCSRKDVESKPRKQSAIAIFRPLTSNIK